MTAAVRCWEIINTFEFTYQDIGLLVHSLHSDKFRSAMIEMWTQCSGTEHTLARNSDTANIRNTLLTQGSEASAWQVAMKCRDRSDLCFLSALEEILDDLLSRIHNRALSIEELKLIQAQDTRQREMFSWFLCFERNEYPDAIDTALNKPFQQLKLIATEAEFVQDCVSRTLKPTVSEEVLQIGYEFLRTFESLRLQDYSLPPVFQRFLTLKTWLNSIQASPGIDLNVFPVPVLPYISSFMSQLLVHHSSPVEYCKKELLRIAFPDILLHCELSQDMNPAEKQELQKDWFCQHKKCFKDFLEESFYDCQGNIKLCAVFTHDAKVLDLPLEIEFEQQVGFSDLQEEGLRESVAEFFLKRKPKVFILNLGLSEVRHLRRVKAIFTEAAGVHLHCEKVLCLLIRTTRRNEIHPSVSWEQPWKISTFETLQDTGNLCGLKSWLRTDTKQLLLSELSFRSSDAIFQRIYRTLPQFSQIVSDRVCQIVNLNNLLNAFKEKLKSRLEEIECNDWKIQVLHEDESLDASDIFKAIQVVLECNIATILTPDILAIENYRAFPSFFLAERNSFIQSVWLQLFQQMRSDTVSGAMVPTDLDLKFPFIAKDYYEIILPCVDEPAEINKKLAQTLNTLEGHPELVDLYIREIVLLDVSQVHLYREAGEMLLILSGSKTHVAKKMLMILKYRRRVFSLCRLQEFSEQREIKVRQIMKEVKEKSATNVRKLLDDVETQTRLYAIEPGKLIVFDCLNEVSVDFPLDSERKMSKCSIVLLEEFLLFCCGGIHKSWIFFDTYSSDASLLSIIGFKVEQTPVPKMNSVRVGHGVVLYMKDVYVFGGDNGNIYAGEQNLQVCEKFSLLQQEWTQLPNMREGRAYFNPCVFHDEIYLCGGYALNIEICHPLEPISIESISVNLPENSSCLAFVQGSAKCVLITGLTRSQFLREDRQLSKQVTHSKYMAWSGCDPVVLGDAVYIMDLEIRAIRWVNRKTGEEISKSKFL